MYDKFQLWLDEALGSADSKGVAGYNFNLYDDGDNNWSIELVGTSLFDEENDDWACEEVFATRENPFVWNEEANWENILDKSVKLVDKYLKNGKHARLLKAAEGIGTGFVDGDLVIIYVKKTGGFFKKLFGGM